MSKIKKTYRLKKEVVNIINQGVDLANSNADEQGLSEISETEFIEKAIVYYYNQTFNLDEIARIKENEHKYFYDIINHLINEHTAALSQNQNLIKEELIKTKEMVKAANAANDTFGRFSNDRMNRPDIRIAIENYNNDEEIIERISHGAAIRKQEEEV